MEQQITNFDYLKPPKEAYLYFPKDIISGKEKKLIRWYFDGDIKYTDWELERLEKFKEYLKEKKQEDLIADWTINQVMREFQGNQFDYSKTRKDIMEQREWIANLPKQITPEIQQFLEFMYISGRDNRFRPILVMNIYKLDMKTMKEEDILNAIDYFNQIVIKYMMIPGQIENWVIVMDLNNASVSSIPLKVIKAIVGYLSNHYKSRLYRLYMVNTTSAISTPWKAIKFFLDAFTVKKINILQDPVPKPMYEHVNQSQVVKKFGGDLPDDGENTKWPSKLNDKGPFLIQGETMDTDFLSVEQYKEKVKKGEIQNGVVCQELVQ